MNENSNLLLRNHVQRSLDDYFAHLDGSEPADLYSIVMQEIEIALIQTVLKHTGNNKSATAKILGMSRGTLRKKITELKQFWS